MFPYRQCSFETLPQEVESAGLFEASPLLKSLGENIYISAAGSAFESSFNSSFPEFAILSFACVFATERMFWLFSASAAIEGTLKRLPLETFEALLLALLISYEFIDLYVPEVSISIGTKIGFS